MAADAAKFIRWYGSHFGAYPYPTFTVGEVDLPLSYGGMEYPGFIFVSAEAPIAATMDGSPTDLLIGHEVAHQWFYSQVGDDQVYDPWLDEAFASYLPYLYYADTSPALFRSLFTARGATAGQPVNSSIYDFPSDSVYFVAVYRQGASFLDELRATMGDADFYAALRDEVATFADKIATPGAVLDLYQRHTQTNLNPLISRYFSYPGFDDPAPPRWQLSVPDGAWRGQASVTIQADLSLSQVEIWLDQRQLYAGSQPPASLDLHDVEPGDYALLVKVWDARGVPYERARRVTVAG
jgi:aminopeptidase N